MNGMIVIESDENSRFCADSRGMRIACGKFSSGGKDVFARGRAWGLDMGVASSGEGREVEQDGGAYVENSVRKILDCPIRHILGAKSFFCRKRNILIVFPYNP